MGHIGYTIQPRVLLYGVVIMQFIIGKYIANSIQLR